MMKYKIWSLILVISLLFSLSIPVYASENIVNENMIQMIAENNSDVMELYDEICSIEIIDVNENLKDQILKAYYYDSEGNYNEVNCDLVLKKVTIKNDNTRSINSDETVYVLTGTTKTSDNDKTKNNVYLYGCICWVDNLGISNEIQYVSGYRTGSYSGTGSYNFIGGTVPLGSGTFSTSFYDSSSNGKAMEFRLNVYSDDASGNQVTLLATTSFFD